MIKGEFSLEDFADQIKQIKKMGSFQQVMDMMPGQMGQSARQMDPGEAEKQLKVTEAIINSMSVRERRYLKHSMPVGEDALHVELVWKCRMSIVY